MRLRIIALPILFITSLVILTVLYRQEINTLFGSNIAANVLIVVWIVADVVSPFFIKATTGPRLSVLDTERNATVELKTKKGISRIHLATIPVVNRQSIFGDTARDAEAGIGYPVILPPVDENDFSYVSLPWLDARGILPSLQISRNTQMKNPSDVIAALVESGYLKYDKISIERGVARGAVVLLGLESTGAIYIANRTPIELPKPTENQMPSLPFWLSVSGDFDIVKSDFFMAAALTWDKIALVPNRNIRPLGSWDAKKGFKATSLRTRIKRYLKYGHV